VITVSTEGVAVAKGEGLMTLVTATIRDLGLVVDKAVVDPSNQNVLATFYVTDFDQKKVRRAVHGSSSRQEGGAALRWKWLSSAHAA
jgi:UTP:GlnB (protein PII) uridylyltransferase